MAYIIDTKSGLYKLAQNSRTVSGKTPVVVTKPATTNKYAAVLQAQAAAGTAKPSVAGETATAAAEHQAKVNSYAQTLKNQAAAGTAKPSVAGETAGAVIQQNPVQPTTKATVSYIDKNGEKQLGYADVVQAENPATTTENPAAADETSAISYWETMRGMYDDLYAQAIAANDAQAAAAAEQARAAADAQLAALASQYEDTNRQLYRDYMQTQKALPQQLAAMGYTGGMSESARLRLGTSYQEALADNERARIAAAAGIESDQAQTAYEIEAARAEANRQALADQAAQEIALEQERYQYEQALQEARVQQMAAAGDFSGLLGMGYSQDEVDYLTRIWLMENPAAQATWIAAHPAEAARLGLVKTGSSSGGSGGGGTYSTTKTAAQLIAGNQQARNYAEILEAQAVANDMARAGATQDEIENVMADGVISGQISYAAAQAAAGTVTNPTAGLTTSELNAMKKSGSSSENSGSKNNLWQSIGNAILAGINN